MFFSKVVIFIFAIYFKKWEKNMAKFPPVKLLSDMRNLFVFELAFTEIWLNGQLIFLCRNGGFEIIVFSPIFGENEHAMTTDSKKLIGMSITHLSDKSLSYRIKNTHVGMDWISLAKGRAQTAIKLAGKIGKCQICEKDYPFPYITKVLVGKVKNACHMENRCPACGTISSFSQDRDFEIKCCKISSEY